MHATLTYRQVLFEYLHYPVSEDPACIEEIAATLIATEPDHFKAHLQSGKLAGPGVLEQLMPHSSLRTLKRNIWARQIEEQHKKAVTSVDPGEPALMRMSRVTMLCQ